MSQNCTCCQSSENIDALPQLLGRVAQNNTDPAPGEYVFVLGQVKEFSPNGVDVTVEFFSKTDQFTAEIRQDLIYIAPQTLVEPCTALYQTSDGDYLRCTQAERHGSVHLTRHGTPFVDDEVAGYYEER